MGNVIPKLKMFMFLSIISLLINIAITITVNGEIGNVFVAGATSFIPFTDLAFNLFQSIGNMPLEFIAVMTLVTLIMSALKTYLIFIMLLNPVPTINV